ncbi:MAG TPA: hypothetical protein VEB42_12795, partial [Chitinophagaceae bacterium]|nr:hypothetical protein [Chitinophagaceae bacterium]
MKQLLTWAAICSLFIACNTGNKEDSGDNDGSKSELDKKISKRDMSITPANAYSSLFMDSSDLEKFIAQKKPADSIVRRMRSFYNARNYQYAW